MNGCQPGGEKHGGKELKKTDFGWKWPNNVLVQARETTVAAFCLHLKLKWQCLNNLTTANSFRPTYLSGHLAG